MPVSHDIVIIGAGMVGLTVAKLLSELPISIGIVETHNIPEWKSEHYSARVSALSLASQEVLKRSGVWSDILSDRTSPFTNMSVWEEGIDSPESLHFSAAEIDVDTLGSIVENELIRNKLHAALHRDSSKAKIHFYMPDSIESLAISEASAQVQLGSGSSLSCKLLIAVDGAHSVTRRLLNLPEASRSYAQYGVVAQLETEKPHLQTAYQRFYVQEVMGLLPLANGNSSMVWSCSQSKAEALLKLSKSELSERVEEFCQQSLGKMQIVDKAQQFPLQLLHSRQYVSNRVVLCGDAAHAVHPLAGQGVNLGMLDAMVLAEVLTNGWTKNYDLGDLSLLREYERSRKSNNVRMMSVLDVLFRLFQSNDPGLIQLRRFGMGIVDKARPVKKILIQQALGLSSIKQQD
jgi:2-octaprenylphenol hydroxylase